MLSTSRFLTDSPYRTLLSVGLFLEKLRFWIADGVGSRREGWGWPGICLNNKSHPRSFSLSLSRLPCSPLVQKPGQVCRRKRFHRYPPRSVSLVGAEGRKINRLLRGRESQAVCLCVRNSGALKRFWCGKS